MDHDADGVVLDQIKTILRRDLKLGSDAEIADDMPLAGGQMDLDSLDILLLMSSLEKHFHIRIPSEAVGRWIFQDVGTLAKYVAENKELLRVADAQPTVTEEPVDYLSRLPHGPEFRFLSTVDGVQSGKTAEGTWQVTGDEDFFKGHFPGRPIVPGVLLIEAAAQLAGIAATVEQNDKVVTAATNSGDDTGRGGGGMLAHADVRFMTPVVPPASIRLRATVTRAAGSLTVCDVSASVADAVVASGSVTLHKEQ